MSDRNPNQPVQPREAERYAELADLMGDFGADAPIAPRRANLDPVFSTEDSASLESALASVDANYPIRPREVPIAGSAMSRSWQAAPGSVARATPVASPLAPQALDAWDLRPTYNPNAQTAEEAFFPGQETAPAMATPDVWPEELAAPEPEILDEDAFQSVLDGLEGDILGDDELAEFSAPPAEETIIVDPVREVPAVEAPVAPVTYAPEYHAAQTYAPESYQPQYQPVDVQVAAPIDPIVEFDPEADFDSVFEDAFAEPLAASDQYDAEIDRAEPEFEEIDFAPNVQTASPRIDQALAVAAGGGVAAVLGSMRANPSRETLSASAELPVTVSNRPAVEAEPLFVGGTQPYDDVPVTGSLKVPEFAAPEAQPSQRSIEYDDFEVDPIPVESAALQPSAKPVVHIAPQNSNVIDDEFDDIDFENAFDDNFNPTEELADLVGSNVAPDLSFTAAKDDDFTPMPAMPPIEAVKAGRGKWLAFGALGLVLIGGLAIYGSSGDSVNSGAEPAIVRADIEPVRVAPDNPGGTVVPNQDRVVFNEVGNGNAVPEAPQEALVDGRQEPAIAAAPVKADDRVLNGDIAEAPAAENGTAVAPRAVQTVTVRPDGTLVTNEPAAPAATQAEVVPEARPEAVATEQPLPAPTVAEAATPASTETPVANAPLAESAAAEAPLQEIAETKVPVRVVELKPVAQKPKVKAKPVQAAEALEAVPSRPSDQPVNIVNPEAPAVPEQPAEQQAAAAEPAPQADALAAGTYAIQIASTPSEEAATSTLRSLSGKFGSVLGGKDYAIQRAEVPGKGTVYRVRILAGSKADAGKLCARYKSAGGSCFVTR